MNDNLPEGTRVRATLGENILVGTLGRPLGRGRYTIWPDGSGDSVAQVWGDWTIEPLPESRSVVPEPGRWYATSPVDGFGAWFCLPDGKLIFRRGGGWLGQPQSPKQFAGLLVPCDPPAGLNTAVEET